MIEVKKEYVGEVIDNLYRLLGIKKNIPHHLAHRPFKQGKIEECVRAISQYLGLPIKINLSYVPSYYNPSYRQGERFTTQALTITNGKGRNVAGITAEVCIPPYLPLYGSSTLVDFPIDVKVGDNVKEYPDTFIAVMAHELSHVVLHSLRCHEKDNEVYADITSMLLGFNDVLESGRKIVTQHKQRSLLSTTIVTKTVTFGYLSEENFRFAHRRVAEILAESRSVQKKFVKQFKFLEKRVNALRDKTLKFKNFMEFIDKSRKINITPEDAYRIVSFHRWGYIEETGKFADTIQEQLLKKQDYKVTNHFAFGLFDNLNKDLEATSSNVTQKEKLLEDDLDVLRRNINPFAKIRMYAKTFWRAREITQR